MKKRVMIIAAWVLAGLMLLAGIYCLLRFGFSIDVLDRSGWNTRRGMVRYMDYYGRPQLGWQYVDGKLYYFFPEDGNMARGLQDIDGGRYYFGQDGVRAIGWQKVGDKTYYLDETGKVITGWCQVDGKNYYFTKEGNMATGWQEIDGKRSYYSHEGVALVGWQTIDGKRYYFDDAGYALTGTVELDGVTYRFTEDGSVFTGWFEDETGKYYLDEDGKHHTGWLDTEGKRYYLGEDGQPVTGWLTLGSNRYYLHEDGTAAVGRVEIDGAVHFFSSKGQYVLFANPWNPVPADYVVKMVSVGGFRFDSVGRDSLQQMLDDCRAAGNTCTINNTYRSKATQQYLWDRSVAKYMAEGMTKEEAEIETGKSTAIPGHSEHQTGLAVDIDGPETTYDWLVEHCWDYGFIVRYPDGKANFTGIIYEPWHFRYVGTELALELRDLGLCLEEYMQMLTPDTEMIPPITGATEKEEDA